MQARSREHVLCAMLSLPLTSRLFLAHLDGAQQNPHVKRYSNMNIMMNQNNIICIRQNSDKVTQS